ncbi:C25 family cysteine peptidase [Hymenobacter endophyticus]
MGQHISEIAVVSSSGTRVLGQLTFTNFANTRGRFPLLASDRSADGKVRITITQKGTGVRPTWGDRAQAAFVRIRHAQTNRWLTRRRQAYFSNDSTLAGSAYFVLDSIPASVRGFDVTDAYNVTRIEGNAGATATQRGFGFPNTVNRTRNLLLFDTSQPLVPQPARRIVFRNISPAAHNFIIVSHPILMKPAGGIANPVRAYAQYRASAVGGGWDTIVVTSQQLYDQFHYGEMSTLAVRQFTLWMMAGSTRPQSLLLLGKGIGVTENSCGFLRQRPDYFGDCSGLNPVRNLVPASTRGVSDAFFTADWPNGSYQARMNTGRVAARTPQQVVNYLNKLKEHEGLGFEPWRKNVIHMFGNLYPYEIAQFESYVDSYATYVQKPPFAGTVIKKYRRPDYPGRLPGEAPPLNLAADFNNGVGFISYFGHGGPNNLAWNVARINDATTGFANKGKYPIWYVSGCSAGNSFTAAGSFGGEDYLLAEEKGIIGFLSDSDLSFDNELHEMHTEMVKLLFADDAWYGKPVAEVQREVTRRLQAANPTASKIAMLMNTIWQGDPALKLFSPLQPDFQTADSRLQISPTVVAAMPSARFELKLGVSNPGRITVGALNIRVTRTFGSTTLTRKC